MAGTLLLTGANSTLALPAISHILTTYPTTTLLLAVRNPSPTADANTAKLHALLALFPTAPVSVRALDLASLASVHTFAAAVHADIAGGTLPRLVAIVCNAMTWSLQSGLQRSADGLERTFQVNHLAHWVLVMRLLGDVDRERGRVVWLGSNSHWKGKAGFEVFAPGLPEELEELVRPGEDREGEEVGRGFQRYGRSKLANVMGMWELGRRLKTNKDLAHIRTLALDPGGLMDSRAFSGANVPALWRGIISVLGVLQPLISRAKPEIRTGKIAGRDLADLALGERFAGEDGYYVNGVADGKGECSPESRDEEVGRRLWEKCAEWGGVGREDTVLEI
ncbi:short-chain dehydrogenase/reductase-like protein sdr [Massariosphaeria phaeospora]|uniref:Short-chain dehydrogenase/reductase-like protein sdr n=1 Tax=Massariosphaeria phaeospora TaxID=100035 RepID=A0A7C8IBB5_9PLEO|nr:short-chain dehydrogenase/reductase-like protein sdr [Massariosphaeria phaeospora]